MSGVLKHGDLAESHTLQHLPLLFDLGEFGLPVLALAGVFGGEGCRVVLEGHGRYAGGVPLYDSVIDVCLRRTALSRF